MPAEMSKGTCEGTTTDSVPSSTPLSKTRCRGIDPYAYLHDVLTRLHSSHLSEACSDYDDRHYCKLERRFTRPGIPVGSQECEPTSGKRSNDCQQNCQQRVLNILVLGSRRARKNYLDNQEISIISAYNTERSTDKSDLRSQQLYRWRGALAPVVQIRSLGFVPERSGDRRSQSSHQWKYNLGHNRPRQQPSLRSRSAPFSMLFSASALCVDSKNEIVGETRVDSKCPRVPQREKA